MGVKTFDDVQAKGDLGAPNGASGVVVLGIGRSGTSAITRAFVTAGFFVGRDGEVLGAAPSNPVGHYEPLSVLDINEELLKERFGRRWWADAPTADEQLSHRAEIEPCLKAVLDALIAAADGAPVAVKEPRINSLLPLWQPVISGILHPVLAVRDPLEIALSHAHRDGTPIGHALAAWEAQTVLVLQSLEGQTVTIAPYGQLTAKNELAAELVRVAAAHLDPDRTARVRPQDASAALHPELHNQTAEGLLHADHLTERQAMLWRYLSALDPGDIRVELPERLRGPSAVARATMRKESERVQLAEERAALLAELSEVRARAAALEQDFAEAAALAQQALVAAEERHTREIEEIKRSPSWRLTAPLRAAKRTVRRPKN